MKTKILTFKEYRIQNALQLQAVLNEKSDYVSFAPATPDWALYCRYSQYLEICCFEKLPILRNFASDLIKKLEDERRLDDFTDLIEAKIKELID